MNLSKIPRRKFCGLLCALRSTGFFRNARCATERVKSVTAKVSGITAEIGAAKKHRQTVHCNQPNRERFGADARFPFFALNGSVHLLHVCLFPVIHSLANGGCRFRSFLVHCVVILVERATPMALPATVLGLLARLI